MVEGRLDRSCFSLITSFLVNCLLKVVICNYCNLSHKFLTLFFVSLGAVVEGTILLGKVMSWSDSRGFRPNTNCNGEIPVVKSSGEMTMLHFHMLVRRLALSLSFYIYSAWAGAKYLVIQTRFLTVHMSP